MFIILVRQANKSFLLFQVCSSRLNFIRSTFFFTIAHHANPLCIENLPNLGKKQQIYLNVITIFFCTNQKFETDNIDNNLKV